MNKFKNYISKTTEALFFIGGAAHLVSSFVEVDKILSFQHVVMAFLSLIVANQINLDRKIKYA